MQSPQNSGLSLEKQSKGNCVLNPQGKSAVARVIKFKREPLDKEANLSPSWALWYSRSQEFAGLRIWQISCSNLSIQVTAQDEMCISSTDHEPLLQT